MACLCFEEFVLFVEHDQGWLLVDRMPLRECVYKVLGHAYASLLQLLIKNLVYL
jgi:hypothetical protein